MRSAPLFAVSFIAFVAGCPAPSMQLADQLGPRGDPCVHLFASHASVPFVASWVNVPFSADLSKRGPAVTATGAVAVDAASPLKPVTLGVEGPAGFAFGIVTADAGQGVITMSDDQVGFTQELAVSVVDVDEFTRIESAEVAEDGIDVPAVDASAVRVFTGGHAAFRVGMLSKGEPALGLGAITASSPDASILGTGGGCIGADNDSFTSAVDIAVLPNALAPVDVTLTAGTASAVMHVVPTPAVEVTGLTAQVASTPTSVDDAAIPFAVQPVNPAPAVVVARAVAGDAPVFGAPVAWSVDNGATIKGRGDALVIPTFGNGGAPSTGSQAPIATPNITATLGTSTTTAQPGVAAAGATFQAVDAAGPFVPVAP